MGKVKNMAWDQATDFLDKVETDLNSGTINKLDAVTKMKNFDGNLALEGIDDEYAMDDWVDMVLTDKSNEVQKLREGGMV
jgi:hypothetical protein